MDFFFWSTNRYGCNSTVPLLSILNGLSGVGPRLITGLNLHDILFVANFGCKPIRQLKPQATYKSRRKKN